MASDGPRHRPVMAEEVLDYLAVRPGGRYLDGTLGLGGHALAVLEAAKGNAVIMGMDKDSTAQRLAHDRLEAAWPGRVRYVNAPFSTFRRHLPDAFGEPAPLLDGALVDLGVSSMQLDEAARGFSFMADGPLDMRMAGAEAEEPSAADLVNTLPVEELKALIRDLGEEPQAGRIARVVAERRQVRPFTRTLELAEAVKDAYPAKWVKTARLHPATRTFQALRMAVNDELGELRAFLDGVMDHLRPGGRVVVISFHSLEDRMVKHAFRDLARDCVCPDNALRCVCDHAPAARVLTKKPVMARPDEVAANPRARGAKLRAAERLAPAMERGGEDADGEGKP